jgi:N-acyl-L-homoserine lactone synthetase
MLTTAIQTQPNQYNDYYSVIAKGPMLDRVYTMRYRSYSAEGYIEENSSQKFIDEYDNQPSSICFLAYQKNKAIGSMRACVYNPSDENSLIPVMEVFENEIRDNVGYDNILVEMNKFVIDTSFQRKGGMQARLTLMGSVFNESVNRNAKAILVAVRPEHARFYQIFGAKVISDIKSYPHLSFKTLLMVCNDLDLAGNILRSKLRAA